MAPEELDLLGRFLFSDPVVEDVVWRETEKAEEGAAVDRRPKDPGFAVIEVLPRPGVTDSEALEALRAAREMGVEGLEIAAVGRRWELEGRELDEAFLDRLAASLLANSLVERWSIGEIDAVFVAGAAVAGTPPVELFDIGSLDDVGLEVLSRQRRAALDLAEMRAIREHFAR
ncbi:MAG TPA: phosphoribosylformylglycinamidine synthase subunit PurS, partial [Rectinemataceae bacterium]|nr:phosphoribosylformylglycinamidine synthase subunit PurS [Rectinemataceae bacterium]